MYGIKSKQLKPKNIQRKYYKILLYYLLLFTIKYSYFVVFLS